MENLLIYNYETDLQHILKKVNTILKEKKLMVIIKWNIDSVSQRIA